jgi:hypothetical protein
MTRAPTKWTRSTLPTYLRPHPKAITTNTEEEADEATASRTTIASFKHRIPSPFRVNSLRLDCMGEECSLGLIARRFREERGAFLCSLSRLSARFLTTQFPATQRDEGQGRDRRKALVREVVVGDERARLEDLPGGLFHRCTRLVLLTPLFLTRELTSSSLSDRWIDSSPSSFVEREHDSSTAAGRHRGDRLQRAQSYPATSNSHWPAEPRSNRYCRDWFVPLRPCTSSLRD